jgi:hypothetical protein
MSSVFFYKNTNNDLAGEFDISPFQNRLALAVFVTNQALLLLLQLVKW